MERQVLLSAAHRLLDRDALDPLRVDDVLDEAGLSTRAFYRHFHGRTELFLALLAEETDRAADRLRARIDRHSSAEAKVRAWVEAILSLAYDSRLAPRARLFAGERASLAQEFPAEVDRCVRTQLAPLEEVIAAGRDDGTFPHADPVADARAVHHLCAGLMADKLWGSGALSRPRALALATGFALQALRADGNQRR
jgi:AcrR family transcriptional regulator